MGKKKQIKISPAGKVTQIYEDDDPYQFVGQTTIRRASRVEPTEDGKWEADMSLLGDEHKDVKLGPFDFRTQAIAAEIAYINKHHLGERQKVQGLHWPDHDYTKTWPGSVYFGSDVNPASGYKYDYWVVKTTLGWSLTYHFGPEDSEYGSGPVWFSNQNKGDALRHIEGQLAVMDTWDLDKDLLYGNYTALVLTKMAILEGVITQPE